MFVWYTVVNILEFWQYGTWKMAIFTFIFSPTKKLTEHCGQKILDILSDIQILLRWLMISTSANPRVPLRCVSVQLIITFPHLWLWYQSPKQGTLEKSEIRYLLVWLAVIYFFGYHECFDFFFFIWPTWFSLSFVFLVHDISNNIWFLNSLTI